MTPPFAAATKAALNTIFLIVPPFGEPDVSGARGAPTKRDYVEDFIAPLQKPTVLNMPFGHSWNPLPLPFGAVAEMDADQQRITIMENIVQDNV